MKWMRRAKRMTQLPLPMKRRSESRRGGVRAGAGRPKEPGAGVPHRARPVHVARHPVHTTLRLMRGLVSVRRASVYRTIERALLLATSARPGFRLVEFSVQRDHLHLIVEGDNGRSLRFGLQGLTIRVARAINRALRRQGKVFGDRYHARSLRTPREVRNALLYVLNNGRKHGTWTGEGTDPCSSGRWFDGWHRHPVYGATPLSVSRSWLLTAGLRKLGLLHVDAVPLRPPIPDRFIEPLLIPI
jgi:hypothetical protein